MDNIDNKTVSGFGDEWARYDQSVMSSEELTELFGRYFKIFPWEKLPENAVGFDMGCGSGRWAKLVADNVGVLHCIDASDKALAVAKTNLKDKKNCKFHLASVDDLPFKNNSVDFGYSLGVLHHIPNTPKALESCVQKIKPGGIFLLYIYYAFDNRPKWFRWIWKFSESFRYVIARMPYVFRYVVSNIIAFLVYFPLSRLAKIFEILGLPIHAIPLSSYKDTSLYTMRTDALDRFGTRLEQRFARDEIKKMMEDAGLTDIRFSEDVPFWCAVGIKK